MKYLTVSQRSIHGGRGDLTYTRRNPFHITVTGHCCTIWHLDNFGPLTSNTYRRSHQTKRKLLVKTKLRCFAVWITLAIVSSSKALIGYVTCFRKLQWLAGNGTGEKNICAYDPPCLCGLYIFITPKWVLT